MNVLINALLFIMITSSVNSSRNRTTYPCCSAQMMDCTKMGKDIGNYCQDCTKPRFGLRYNCGISRCNLVGCNCRTGCKPLAPGARIIAHGPY